MADTDLPPHDHAASDACQLCPICLLIGVTTEMRPEVRTHLRAAGRELMLAMRAALEDVEADEEPASSGHLRRIDLDED